MGGGLPLREPLALVLRLVFLDAGTGKFTIGYDSRNGAKTLREVKKRDSGAWKELCITVQDGAFAGRGPAGSDLWLANSDDQDDVFDSVEIASGAIEDLA